MLDEAMETWRGDAQLEPLEAPSEAPLAWPLEWPLAAPLVPLEVSAEGHMLKVEI